MLKHPKDFDKYKAGSFTLLRFSKDKLPCPGTCRTPLDLNAHQCGLPAQPIDPPHAAFPTTSHPCAPSFIGIGDSALHWAVMAQTVPFLARYMCPECSVQRAKNIENCDGIGL